MSAGNVSAPRQISIAFQTDKTAGRYIELAQFLDRYDFDAVNVYCDLPYQPPYAPLLLMAPHLHRVRLGVAAIPLARMHPLDIAANTALLATAAAAAGGVSVGIARGAWLEDYGLAEPQPPIPAIREAIALIRHWLGGGAGFEGEIYHLPPHSRALYPLPAQMPSFLIGTWGRKLAALAGEIADEVKVGGSANPDIVPYIANFIAEGERAAGRTVGNVGVVMGAVSVIDDDRNAARRAAKRAVALYLPVVAPLDLTVHIDPELLTRVRQYNEAKQYDDAARLISDELLERFAFAGDADDIIRQCERLFAAGARRIEFGTPHGIDHAETGIRLLGERVIPALRHHS